MMNQNHIIKKQILEFTLDSEIGSYTFQSGVSKFFKTEIIPLIDVHCTGISGDEVVRIDRLELDLGLIAKKNFMADFKARFNTLFTEKLLKTLAAKEAEHLSSFFLSGPSSEVQVGITEVARDFEVLDFLLREGRLPWWVKSGELYDLSALLEQSVTNEPVKLKKLLLEISNRPDSVKRLVYHANDSLLEKLIALFQPLEYTKIYNLSCSLIGIFTGCPLLASAGSLQIRSEVWTIVYSHCSAYEGRSIDWRTLIATVVKGISRISGADGKGLQKFVAENINRVFFKKIEKYAIAKPNGIRGLKSTKAGKSGKGEPETSIAIKKLVDKSIRSEMLGDLFPLLNRIQSGEFFPQLEIIEKLLTELQVTLLSDAAKTDLTVAGRLLLEGIGRKLPRQVKVIQKTGGKIVELQSRKGQTSIFVKTPARMEKYLKREAAELESIFEKIRLELTAVLAQKILTEEMVITKKLTNVIESLEELQQSQLPRPGLSLNASFSDTAEIYIANAGIILLWPYLSSFFEIIGLTKQKLFVSETARERAVLILQYLACATGTIQEYDLSLNKILCGLRPAASVGPYFEITAKEKRETENLLQAVIHNWPALKDLSVPGLRNLFLMREGMIYIRDDHWVLRVAEQAYDILLDKMPWGIGTVKLPWMEELLLVEWRM